MSIQHDRVRFESSELGLARGAAVVVLVALALLTLAVLLWSLLDVLL